TSGKDFGDSFWSRAIIFFGRPLELAASASTQPTKKNKSQKLSRVIEKTKKCSTKSGKKR
ncbi:4002_t:CDS:1, partial [Funneliformis mosseae]